MCACREQLAFVVGTPVVARAGAPTVKPGSSRGETRRRVLSRSLKKTAKGTRRAVATGLKSTRLRVQHAARVINRGMQIAGLMALVALLGLLLSIIFPPQAGAYLEVSAGLIKMPQQALIAVVQLVLLTTAAAAIMYIRKHGPLQRRDRQTLR
mmetsp:Transcript_2722/g.8255  ORF Transcript_2722/g.8255 Transcript_2722/m.8255 type:complete len:153 (-) Transcript_2722:108-566(-)